MTSLHLDVTRLQSAIAAISRHLTRLARELEDIEAQVVPVIPTYDLASDGGAAHQAAEDPVAGDDPAPPSPPAEPYPSSPLPSKYGQVPAQELAQMRAQTVK